MKQLLIIGARGWGREVLGTVRALPEYQSGELTVKGFLDDKADALEGLRGDFPPIISSVEAYEPQADDVFICALGDCTYRRKYAEMILAKGGKFISVVNPSTKINSSIKLGQGVFIGALCVITNNVTIGDFSAIHSFSVLGHDVTIGAYNTVEAYCFFGGYAQTGENTTMHVRSAIIPHKRVGNNCSIGFGSVVMRNFGDNLHLFGNPAKKIEF